MDILVTNNPLVQSQYQNDFRVVFLDTDLLGLLTYIRDRIHNGFRLLTHPLSGSIKPNESPYKSVLLTEVKNKTGVKSETGTQSEPKTQPETDFQSVSIIEECIITVQKFPTKNIPEQYLNDLRTVDLSLIRTALKTAVK